MRFDTDTEVWRNAKGTRTSRHTSTHRCVQTRINAHITCLCTA
jgi:hypothetical protein